MTDVSSTFQPRCKVCQHDSRDEIDLALARRQPYRRLQREFDLPYRSLANHARRHLDRDAPAIRAVIDAELAVADRNREIGVRVGVERRMMLDLAIKTYFDLLVAGRTGAGKV